MLSIPPWVLLILFTQIFFVLGIFFEQVRQSHAEDYKSTAIIVGAIGTWLALVVNAIITTNNAKKQHTINILFSTRLNSQIYTDHLKRFLKTYPPGTILPITDFLEKIKMEKSTEPSDMSSKEARVEARKIREASQFVDSVHYLLNYYEFLAKGARSSELDEELLKHTIRGPFLRLTNQLVHVIQYYHGLTKDHYGNATLEHVVHLRELWGAPYGAPSQEVKSAIEKENSEVPTQ